MEFMSHARRECTTFIARVLLIVLCFFFEKRIKVNQRLIEPFGGKSRDLKNDLGFLLQQKRCRKNFFLAKQTTKRNLFHGVSTSNHQNL